jgi:2-C-methyl-D-erythritol 4-phosphate cytidylyltransferase/2-C-methyl-D-erythritol 2,4-cyclodiphosphate synthase
VVVHTRKPGVASLGIVPVEAVDPDAPLGSAAFRELRGRPLLHWAVTALTASGVVRRVLVVLPPALAAPAREVLADAAGAELHAVTADDAGARILAALRIGHERGVDDMVVVHDPLHALSSAAVVRTVVAELADRPDLVAAVPARPVTDTLKWVDEDEVVLDTADREGYRVIASPQAYRRPAVLEALAGADPGVDLCGTETLPRLVTARGGRVALVPLQTESLRVVTEDDVALAEALLAADADLRRHVGPGQER